MAAVGAGGADPHPGALRHAASSPRTCRQAAGPLLRLVQPPFRPRPRRYQGGVRRPAPPRPARPAAVCAGSPSPGCAVHAPADLVPAGRGPGRADRAVQLPPVRQAERPRTVLSTRHRLLPEGREASVEVGDGRRRLRLRRLGPERRHCLHPPEGHGCGARAAEPRRPGAGRAGRVLPRSVARGCCLLPPAMRGLGTSGFDFSTAGRRTVPVTSACRTHPRPASAAAAQGPLLANARTERPGRHAAVRVDR